MFRYDIVEFNEFGAEVTGSKTFYNVDGNLKASEWVRKPLKGLKTYDCPQMTSAVKYKNIDGSGKVTSNHLGYMLSNANSVQSNSTNVALFSTGIYKGHGFSVTPNNFEHSVTLFAARKLIEPTWLNEKDEYFAPNEQHESWKQFFYDSIIFSLFNNSSEQSSLRGIVYKGQNWDVPNEFFWMSNKEIIELAGSVMNHDIMNQISIKERYVCNLLYGVEKIINKLSPEARQVVEMANELTRTTIIYRAEYGDYENQAYNWDSGYSQLKKLWRDKLPTDFTEFRRLYKVMEDRMRPLVYELGFLMK